MNDNRYRYYEAGNKVIAVITYKGKTIRGVAVCADGDKFDREFGRKLARAKCEAKIAKIRYVNLKRDYDEALELELNIIKKVSKLGNRCDNAMKAMFVAEDNLNLLLKGI